MDGEAPAPAGGWPPWAPANAQLTPIIWSTSCRTFHSLHGVGFDSSSGRRLAIIRSASSRVRWNIAIGSTFMLLSALQGGLPVARVDVALQGRPRRRDEPVGEEERDVA